MEKSGTYTCKTCGEKLFSSREKIGAGANSIAFKKPHAEDKLQTRKNESGQWLVRCATCRSELGSVVGGKNPHYRVQSAQTHFVEDDIDIELPEFEKKEDENEKKEREASSQTSAGTPSAAMSAMTLFVAGSAVGGILGATAAFLMCRNLQEPLVANNLEATTTALVAGEENTSPAPQAPAPLPTPPIIPTPRGSSDAATSTAPNVEAVPTRI